MKLDEKQRRFTGNTGKDNEKYGKSMENPGLLRVLRGFSSEASHFRRLVDVDPLIRDHLATSR